MFCFAGLQKLANPRFFDAADPASIQSQLAGAAWRSPVHALISPLAHIAVPLGFLIAFGELAVGMGTLLGPAAAGGLALSLMLFLTVSFHSAPYYTGADIVFEFAWTPLLLAGSGSVIVATMVVERAVRKASSHRGSAR
jgi:thiosulfate dehydrogenase [quinone] large subunit